LKQPQNKIQLKKTKQKKTISVVSFNRVIVDAMLAASLAGTQAKSIR
jgi:hypothetical protein